MSDLTTFLLARLAEDEATWSLDFSTPDDVPVTLMVGDAATSIVAPSGFASRMRADVQAKRAIVGWHCDGADGQYGAGVHFCAVCADGVEDRLDWPCPTLRALSAPYADHPDYRDEWRP